MEETMEAPSQVNRFQLDGMHNIDIVLWNKKRKLQSDQFDLLRPKHKCWVGSFSSEHASIFEENPVSDSMYRHAVNTRTDSTILDDRSGPESAKDNNSFIEDSDTAISVNEEAEREADCANTYIYVKTLRYSEDDIFVDSKCNPSNHDADMQALMNHEEHLLGLEDCSDHIYSDYANDISQHSKDKELEDFLCSSRLNPNMYVLSSGRLNANQEAQSSTRPPTIDQEFEQYFSMLML